MADTPSAVAEGGEIPAYVSKLPEAKILSDLFSIRTDMQVVVDSLNRLLAGEKDNLLAQALFSTALITYRRCFTSGVRSGLTHQDVEGLQNNAGDFHAYLIGMASKLIAHSVNPFEKVASGIMVKDNQVYGIQSLNIRLANMPPDKLQQWGRLALEVFNVVHVPRLVAAQTALADAARKLPISEITSMPPLELSPFVPDVEANQRREG